MKLKDRITESVIALLQGTCEGYPDEQSLFKALYNLKLVTEKQEHNHTKLERMWNKIETYVCAELDNQIFLCDSCGWWYEIHERNDTGVFCQDCSEE